MASWSSAAIKPGGLEEGTASLRKAAELPQPTIPSHEV